MIKQNPSPLENWLKRACKGKQSNLIGIRSLHARYDRANSGVFRDSDDERSAAAAGASAGELRPVVVDVVDGDGHDDGGGLDGRSAVGGGHGEAQLWRRLAVQLGAQYQRTYMKRNNIICTILQYTDQYDSK